MNEDFEAELRRRIASEGTAWRGSSPWASQAQYRAATVTGWRRGLTGARGWAVAGATAAALAGGGVAAAAHDGFTIPIVGIHVGATHPAVSPLVHESPSSEPTPEATPEAARPSAIPLGKAEPTPDSHPSKKPHDLHSTPGPGKPSSGHGRGPGETPGPDESHDSDPRHGGPDSPGSEKSESPAAGGHAG